VTFFRWSGQFIPTSRTSFLRILCTKNCWNWLIFDWVIPKNKKGDSFWDTLYIQWLMFKVQNDIEVLISHLTQYSFLWRQSAQPITWLVQKKQLKYTVIIMEISQIKINKEIKIYINKKYIQTYTVCIDKHMTYRNSATKRMSHLQPAFLLLSCSLHQAL